MAVVNQAWNSGSVGFNQTSTSVTITSPTSGSELLAVVSVRRGGTSAPAAPAGWTRIQDYSNDGTHSFWVYRKISDGLETGFSVSWSNSGRVYTEVIELVSTLTYTSSNIVNSGSLVTSQAGTALAGSGDFEGISILCISINGGPQTFTPDNSFTKEFQRFNTFTTAYPGIALASRTYSGLASSQTTWTADTASTDMGVVMLNYASAGGSNTLDADSGSYALSGTAATLLKSSVSQSDSGGYSLSGSDVGFSVSKKLIADSGLYSISGASVSLVKSSVLVSDSGGYSLTGQDVTLTYNQSTVYTLDADSGAYRLSGNNAVLAYNQSLRAECSLVDRTGKALPNLTAIDWAWFDSNTPASFIAPTDQGSTESTDGTGQIVVKIPNTTLTAGQIGTLVLRNQAGDIMGAYNLEVQ
jgi:hypothetical protein